MFIDMEREIFHKWNILQSLFFSILVEQKGEHNSPPCGVRCYMWFNLHNVEVPCFAKPQQRAGICFFDRISSAAMLQNKCGDEQKCRYSKVNSAFAFDNVRQPLYLGQQFLSVSFDSAIRQKALHLLRARTTSRQPKRMKYPAWENFSRRVAVFCVSRHCASRDKLNFTLGPTPAAR